MEITNQSFLETIQGVKNYPENIKILTAKYKSLSIKDLENRPGLQLLLLCGVYKRQQNQSCILDIRHFEYGNKETYVKVKSLKLAIQFEEKSESEKFSFDNLNENTLQDKDFIDGLFWFFKN